MKDVNTPSLPTLEAALGLSFAELARSIRENIEQAKIEPTQHIKTDLLLHLCKIFQPFTAFRRVI